MSSNRAPRRRRWLARIAIVVTALVAADQLVQHVLIRDGYLFGRRIAPFDPPLFVSHQVETLARLRQLATQQNPKLEGEVRFDAELGWTNPRSTDGSAQFDALGARIGVTALAAKKPPGVRRIAVYGCSFTMGSEVGAAEAWPAVLDAERDDLELLNLGVAGYGLDQALLRFRRCDASTDADEVWLGILPSACLRVLNVYRPALRHYTSTVAFKPRFRLGPEDALELVPSPADSISELVETVTNADRFWAAVHGADALVDRVKAAYRPDGSHFAHYSATLRVLLTALERGGRDIGPHLEDPTAECFRIVRAIATAMHTETTRSGRSFRVVILPARAALLDRAAGATSPWDRLVAELRDQGLEVTDPSDALIAAGLAANDENWAPGHHYSAAGNRIVARTLAPN